MEHEDLIPVEGHNNLFRDRDTGAIINTDSSGYNQYKKMKQRRQTEREELDILRKDIDEIKSLLRELTNGSRSN